MPVVEFNVAGAGKIPAEYDAIGAATDKVAKKNESLGKTYKVTAADATRLGRVEQQILRDTETALERKNRKLADAKKALAGNARETELLARETKRLEEAYQKEADVETGAAQKRLENLKKTAEASRLEQQIIRDTETALERKNRKLAEAKKALAGNARETELLARETKRLEAIYQAETAAGRKAAEARQLALTQSHLATQNLGPLIAQNTKLFANQSGKVLDLGRNVQALGVAQEVTFGAGALRRLGSLAAGYFSIQAAIRLVTEEIRGQQELVNKQSATQLTVSQSRNLVLRNTISQSPAERRRILAASVGLADKTSISEVAINAGLAEALSASGGKVDPSLAAVEVAARFLADRPDEIGEAAGALLGISKVTGTTDARVNLGLLTRIGELGRVVNPKLQAENIAPALVGAAQFGGTASGAGALFAALSNAAEDKEGRRTGTALIQLARQLDDFQLGEGFEKFQGQFDRANLTQRIGFLQRNKKAAEQFLDKASFETKLVGPITGLLLDPNTSNAAKEFARFRALIPGNDDLASVGEDALNVFSANDLDSRAAAQRGLKRSIEAFELIDRDSVSQEEREILQDLLARTGSTVVGAKVDNFLAGLGDGSPGLDRKELVRLLRNRRDKLGVDTFAGLQIPELDGSKPNITPEEQRQVDILTQLIEVLERVTPKTEDGSSQLDESKKQTELLEQIAAKEGGLVGVAE